MTIQNISETIQSSSKRILAFDLLRGYFLFVILIDHLQRFPGFYEIFTGKGYLWASAAEGFFFVSGILIGILRGRKDQDKPIGEVSKKLLLRALTLYLWAVGLTLLFTVLGYIFITNTQLKPGLDTSSDWLNIIFRAATFQYTYGWADFLQYYAVFMAFTPLVIIALRKNLWWVVAMVSVVVWFFGGSNMFLTWQILFFGGVVVGYYNEQLLVWFRKLKPALQSTAKIFVVVLALGTVVMSALLVFASDHSMVFRTLNNATHHLFVKEQLPIVRLSVFVLWFFALLVIVKRYQQVLAKTVGKVLIPFGQNSLYVYILQAFVLFILNLALPNNLGFIVNVVINTLVILLVWLAVKKRFLFSVIPR